MTTMSRKKHFFNMVEVALALLVISLGLSTVLTLFPAGLKATREAENANNLVEAAEYAFSYFQAKTYENKGWSSITTASSTGGDSTPAANDDRIEDKGNGIYVYHKAFESLVASRVFIEDFSCVIRILDAEHGMKSGATQDSFVVSVPTVSNGPSTSSPSREHGNYVDNSANNSSFWLAKKNMKVGSPSAPNNQKVEDVVKVFNIELSYPATTDYSNRQKKIFRMVLLNPEYVPYIP